MKYDTDSRIVEHLHELGAGCLWQQRIPRIGLLEAWALGGASLQQCVVLVMHYADGHGFEVYMPAAHTNKVADTFAALKKAA